jgi:GT2 family glycosyltransferase
VILENICTAVLRDGDKLYKHFKSIDHDVKRYFIIDNSCGQDISVTETLEQIKKEKPKHIREVVVLKSTQNTGYPGAVNLAIKQNVDCSYWLFTGFDWYAAPGEYKKLSEHISKFKYGATLGEGNDEMCGILLKAAAIASIGLMDENFYPGYFEDNDYRYRQKLSGCLLDSFPLSNEHLTSSTLKSSTQFQIKNQMTFQQNFDYYVQKWGGSPGYEQYDTPFDDDYPIDYWKYNPKRIHSLRWT